MFWQRTVNNSRSVLDIALDQVTWLQLIILCNMLLGYMLYLCVIHRIY